MTTSESKCRFFFRKRIDSYRFESRIGMLYTPPLSFLQAGCPSCRPTNSVKAMKEIARSGVVDLLYRHPICCRLTGQTLINELVATLLTRLLRKSYLRWRVARRRRAVWVRWCSRCRRRASDGRSRGGEWRGRTPARRSRSRSLTNQTRNWVTFCDPVTRESSDPETQLTRWPCSIMNSKCRLMLQTSA